MKILLLMLAGALAGGLVSEARGMGAVLMGALFGLAIALLSQRLQVQEKRLADQDAKLRYLYEQWSALQANSGQSHQAAFTAEPSTAPSVEAVPQQSPDTADFESLEPVMFGKSAATSPAAPDLIVAPHRETGPQPEFQAPRGLPPEHEDALGVPPLKTPGRLQAWLFGGNTVVRLGVVVLFFGLAFLLQYAYQHAVVPPELRLTGAALFGLCLLGLGWKLRLARPGYALSLQGAAVGALYLTIFAALRLYHLLPASAAFVLLVLIAALSALLALLQNSMAFAMLGAGGGFLAPILASTGSGSHVQLFSYYLLLDLGILAIAWKRAWRPLNLLGFVATFGIGAAWGLRFYRPEFFASTEPFLFAFLLIFSALPMLFARQPRAGGANYVDGTLVFGTPIAAFAMQAGLVRDMQYGLAWTAVALGAAYLTAASIMLRRGQAAIRLTAEAHFALGLCFTALVFPLAFDARVSSAAWALEGCGMLWLGLRQSRMLPRLAGYALQLLSGLAYLSTFADTGWHTESALPVLNAEFLGGALIALAGLFSSWLEERYTAGQAARKLGAESFLFAWGWLWWVGNGLRECALHAGLQDFAAGLIFLSLSWLGLSLLARRSTWQVAEVICPWLIAVLGLAGTLQLTLGQAAHPAEHSGWLAWPLALGAALVLLHRHEHQHAERAALFHAGLLWLGTALVAREFGWQVGRVVPESSAWAAAAWASIPAAVLAGLSLRGRRIAWPVAAHEAAYLDLGCLPIAVFLPAWAIWANINYDGTAAPLPYFPIANPLDLALAAALITPMLWSAERRQAGPAGARAAHHGLLALAGLITLNGVLLRSFHHWLPVAYEAHALFASSAVEAGIAVLWTTLGCLLMFAATRRRARKVWLGGAALLAATVLKLLLIDLQNSGTVARIVAFMGVGIVMLVIGYVAPVPPAQKPEAEAH
ncbi:MAG: DUF2339 domain-containing protein [Rhodocyclaceae bacterium]|nr:DUF2339 domain-containing protein [Rhodocyclaceae bacterium]